MKRTKDKTSSREHRRKENIENDNFYSENNGETYYSGMKKKKEQSRKLR
jgi:hypothetical protein